MYGFELMVLFVLIGGFVFSNCQLFYLSDICDEFDVFLQLCVFVMLLIYLCVLLFVGYVLLCVVLVLLVIVLLLEKFVCEVEVVFDVLFVEIYGSIEIGQIVICCML